MTMCKRYSEPCLVGVDWENKINGRRTDGVLRCEDGNYGEHDAGSFRGCSHCQAFVNGWMAALEKDKSQ